MRRKLGALLIVLVLGMMFVMDGNGVVADAPKQSPPTNNPSYTVEFVARHSELLPNEARQAIVKSLDAWQEAPPENNRFYLIGLRWEETWALGTMTSANLDSPIPEDKESHLNFDNLISILVAKTENGWQAAIDIDQQVYNLLEYVPEAELSQDARQAIFPPTNQIRQRKVEARQQYNNYKLPWRPNEPWKLAGGWHDLEDNWNWYGQVDPHNSLDFIPPHPSSGHEILASAPGSVEYICDVLTNVDILGMSPK